MYLRKFSENSFSYCVTPSPRSNLSGKELMNLKRVKQVPIRLRVLNVIKYWVENHYEVTLPLLRYCFLFKILI